jgi:hypothetical protein
VGGGAVLHLRCAWNKPSASCPFLLLLVPFWFDCYPPRREALQRPGFLWLPPVHHCRGRRLSRDKCLVPSGRVSATPPPRSHGRGSYRGGPRELDPGFARDQHGAGHDAHRACRRFAQQPLCRLGCQDCGRSARPARRGTVGKVPAAADRDSSRHAASASRTCTSHRRRNLRARLADASRHRRRVSGTARDRGTGVELGSIREARLGQLASARRRLPPRAFPRLSDDWQVEQHCRRTSVSFHASLSTRAQTVARDLRAPAATRLGRRCGGTNRSAAGRDRGGKRLRRPESLHTCVSSPRGSDALGVPQALARLPL